VVLAEVRPMIAWEALAYGLPFRIHDKNVVAPY
jgi:hypothetical protein